MADDELSAAELETLLAAGRIGTLSQCSSRWPDSSVDALPRVPQPAAPPLCEKLKRAVLAVADQCGRRSAAELSTLLRRAVHVEVVSAAQVTCDEFLARLSNPTCFQLLAVAAAGAHWMLDASPAILHPAIDCMLGGGRGGAPAVSRPLTDIELRLARRVTGVLVRELQAAWRNVVELELSVERVASRGELPSTIQRDAPLLGLRFEVAFTAAHGAVHLAIPTSWLAGVADKLTGEAGGRAPAANSAAPGDETAHVEVVANLAQVPITAEELRDLSLGDVITTDQSLDALVAVFENGVFKFHARAGALEGHKAIEIEQPVDETPGTTPEAA